MTRVARPIAFDFDLSLSLLIGPVDSYGFTDEDLRLAWHYHGPDLMDDHPGHGWRPWGWWAFEAGEEQPPREQEPVRLAELGALRPEELAALRERANEARLRVGTAGERISASGCASERRPDREAVELFDAVERARQRQRGHDDD